MAPLEIAARDLARTCDDYDVTLTQIAFLADDALGMDDMDLFEFLAREFHDLRACRLRDTGSDGEVWT